MFWGHLLYSIRKPEQVRGVTTYNIFTLLSNQMDKVIFKMLFLSKFAVAESYGKYQ